MHLADAAKSAEDLKKVATKAAEKDVISREDAAAIKKAATDVQSAAAIGDHKTANETVKALQDRVDELVAEKNGPEVAEKLKKAEEKKGNKTLSNLIKNLSNFLFVLNLNRVSEYAYKYTLFLSRRFIFT